MKKLVNGEGIMNPVIAIIGEAPGADEEIQGRPFVGRSGQLLDYVLKRVNVDRSTSYITNVVKFRPINNATPTNDQIDEWRPLLYQEIARVKPLIIICLGATALKAISGMNDAKITVERGKVWHSLILKCHYVGTFHPSYCLRFPNETHKMIEDFNTALNFLRGI